MWRLLLQPVEFLMTDTSQLVVFDKGLVGSQGTEASQMEQRLATI